MRVRVRVRVRRGRLQGMAFRLWGQSRSHSAASRGNKCVVGVNGGGLSWPAHTMEEKFEPPEGTDAIVTPIVQISGSGEL